jgi:hypothetical protein
MFEQSLAAGVAVSDAPAAAAKPSAFEPSSTIHPVVDQIRSGLPGHGVVCPVEHLNAVRSEAERLRQMGLDSFVLTQDAPNSRFTRLQYEGQPTALYMKVYMGTATFAVSAADLRAAQRVDRRGKQEGDKQNGGKR